MNLTIFQKEDAANNNKSNFFLKINASLAKYVGNTYSQNLESQRKWEKLLQNQVTKGFDRSRVTINTGQ